MIRDFSLLVKEADSKDRCRRAYMHHTQHDQCGPSLLRFVLPLLTGEDLLWAGMAANGFKKTWLVLAELLQEFGEAPEGLELYRLQSAPGSHSISSAVTDYWHPVQVPRWSPLEMVGGTEPEPTIEVETALIRPMWKWKVPWSVFAWGWDEEERLLVFWSQERGQ